MRFILPILLFCVITSYSFSQAPVLQKDARALVLLQECQTAMGIPDAHVQVVARGTIQDTTHQDTPRAFTIKNIGREQVLWQEEYPEGPLKRVLNGENSYQSYKDSKQTVQAFESTFAHPEHLPALSCAIEDTSQPLNVLYLGQETLNGLAVDHIQFNAVITPQDSASRNLQLVSDFHVYLDTTTHLVLGTKKYAFSPKSISNHSEWQVIYGEYKSVRGIQMPSSIDVYVSDRQFQHIQLSSFDFDTKISSQDFE